MFPATFFLSTGRCGTQWLARFLNRYFGQQFYVEHEPLQTEYQSRRTLARVNGRVIEPTSAAVAHIESVQKKLEIKPYIECGHPCWSSLPWIAEKLGNQLQIVHLVRDPIATAASWVSRGAYIPPILPHVPERVLISPLDVGCQFTEYREKWPGLLPFEKCLVYWAEVNAFALQMERNFSGRWLRLHYEELFSALAATRLLEFLGLPAEQGFLDARAIREDQFRSLPESTCEPSLLQGHPQILALAKTLGYEHAFEGSSSP